MEFGIFLFLWFHGACFYYGLASGGTGSGIEYIANIFLGLLLWPFLLGVLLKEKLKW